MAPSRVSQPPVKTSTARHAWRRRLNVPAGVLRRQSEGSPVTYIGHSSITITLDRYGHLMPGNEAQAAALLDTYLESLGTTRAK